MANDRIASIFAEKLVTGVMHPGKDGKPPTEVRLPGLRVAENMPQEYGDLINETVRLLAEALVNEIETTGDSVIISHAEYNELRNTVESMDDKARTLSVHCTCDTGQSRPLASMRIGAGGKAIVNGKQFIQALAIKDAECPHDIIDSRT